MHIIPHYCRIRASAVRRSRDELPKRSTRGSRRRDLRLDRIIASSTHEYCIAQHWRALVSHSLRRNARRNARAPLGRLCSTRAAEKEALLLRVETLSQSSASASAFAFADRSRAHVFAWNGYGYGYVTNVSDNVTRSALVRCVRSRQLARARGAHGAHLRWWLSAGVH